MSALLTPEMFYSVMALFLAISALLSFLAGDGRQAAFWILLSALLVSADYVSPFLLGVGVVLLALLAKDPTKKSQHNEQNKPVSLLRLLLPLLALPLLTLLFVTLHPLSIPGIGSVLSDKHYQLSALGLAAVLSFIFAGLLLREKRLSAYTAGNRLLLQTGWAVVLPTLLAALGAVMAKANIGLSLSGLLSAYFPLYWPSVSLVVFIVGMVLLTMAMGNAFAVFPIMMGAIGLPVLVLQHQMNILPLAAIGMLSGYCGTLMTPMAANYNLVPAALMGLNDSYLVIRQQVKTALLILLFNTGLLFYLL